MNTKQMAKPFVSYATKAKLMIRTFSLGITLISSKENSISQKIQNFDYSFKKYFKPKRS